MRHLLVNWRRRRVMSHVVSPPRFGKTQSSVGMLVPWLLYYLVPRRPTSSATDQGDEHEEDDWTTGVQILKLGAEWLRRLKS